MHSNSVRAGVLLLFLFVASFGTGWSTYAGEQENEGLAAKVNGKGITMEALERNMTMAEKRYELAKKQLSDEQKKVLKANLLEVMIDETLLVAEADRRGIQVTDAELDDVLSQHKARYGTKERLEKMIEESGRTIEEFRESVRKGIRIKKVLEEAVGAQERTMDQEARAYYDEHPDKYRLEETVKVGTILVRAKAEAEEESRKQAREKAEAILNRLRSGEDFATVAKETSEGPKAAQGGLLGYIIRGRLPGELEEVAFSLKPGEVSDIIETQYGYHILKVFDVRPSAMIPFEEVRASIERQISVVDIEQKKMDYINRLRQNAEIERFL